MTLIVVAQPEPTDQIRVDLNPISIVGQVGQDTFSETVFLSSSGATLAGFQLLARALQSDDGDITLPRSAIEPPASKEIPRGEQIPVELKVRGISKPGNYSAQVTFVPRGQPPERGTVVTMVVTAKGMPTLSVAENAGVDKFTLKLTRCLWCWLERRLGIASDSEEAQTLDFDTPPRVPVTITSARIVARGDNQQDAVTREQVEVSWAGIEGNTVPITITAHPTSLTPDQYTGRVKMTLEDADSPVIVPLSVAVKDGPLKAFLITLAGVLAAWVFRAWTRQNDIWRAYEGVDQVEQRARVEAPHDWQLVTPGLERAHGTIRRGQPEVAAEILKAVGKRIDVLVAARLIQDAAPLPSPALTCSGWSCRTA